MVINLQLNMKNKFERWCEHSNDHPRILKTFYDRFDLVEYSLFAALQDLKNISVSPYFLARKPPQNSQLNNWKYVKIECNWKAKSHKPKLYTWKRRACGKPRGKDRARR